MHWEISVKYYKRQLYSQMSPETLQSNNLVHRCHQLLLTPVCLGTKHVWSSWSFLEELGTMCSGPKTKKNPHRLSATSLKVRVCNESGCVSYSFVKRSSTQKQYLFPGTVHPHILQQANPKPVSACIIKAGQRKKRVWVLARQTVFNITKSLQSDKSFNVHIFCENWCKIFQILTNEMHPGQDATPSDHILSDNHTQALLWVI